MDRQYWIDKWQQDKDFYIENDRLKEKEYIYTPFPKANLFGFQNGDIRKLIYCDILARYERMQEKNVLFPTGCHSLCNTSFVENKKYSNLLNDDISNMFTNQMLKLGIGINDAKHIDMRHNEYLSNLQQAFIDLYQRGYIEYKDSKVYYDKANNKIYDYMNHPKNTQVINYKCFVLKIKDIIPNVIEQIQNIDGTQELKDKLICAFCPKQVMEFELCISNGTQLKVFMDEPQFIGGVSFIFLNPEFIDITDYVDINEYHSVFSYLEGTNSESMFAFSGLFARNPLTGKEIPIFISTLFQKDIYLGIPSVDEDDNALACQEELEIIPILENDIFINSDFLDGLTIEEAKNTIFTVFLEEKIAQSHIKYQNDEIVLSSLDNFGALFPFLEDKDTNDIKPLTGHLPYAFSSKLRPVLIDNVDIIGTTMNGTMNNLFTEGMCPILAMLYDNIGSIISIFSKEAINEFKSWKGIEYLAIGNNDIYSNVLMPIILYQIIQKETVILPKLIHKVDVFVKTIDIAHKDIKRANNNLIDLDNLLEKYESDSIRYFSAASEIDSLFIFDTYQLDDIDKDIKKLEEALNVIAKENASVDYALFNLVKEVNSALSKKDLKIYSKLIMEFIKNYIFCYGLSKNQILLFIKLIYPIFPFIAESTYKKILNSKYSIINETWPN